MKVLGYLLILALFGDKTLDENMKDFSIEVKKVGQLFTNIFKQRNATDEPVFTEEDVRQSSFVNKGTVAKYYSKSLRDYVVHHNVSSDEEGFVVTIKKSKISNEDNSDIASKEVDNKIPTVFFIPTHEEALNDVDEKDLNSALSGYVEKVKKEIDAENSVVDAHSSAEIIQGDNKTNNLKVHPTDKNDTTLLEDLNSSNISDVKILNIDGATEIILTNADTLNKSVIHNLRSSESKLDNKTIHLKVQLTNERVGTVLKELNSSISSEVKVLSGDGKNQSILPNFGNKNQSEKDTNKTKLYVYHTNENVTTKPKESNSSNISDGNILNSDNTNQSTLIYLDTLNKPEIDTNKTELKVHHTNENVKNLPKEESNSSNINDVKLWDVDDRKLNTSDLTDKPEILDTYSTESNEETTTNLTQKILNGDDTPEHNSTDPTFKIIDDDDSFDDNNRYDFVYDSEESEIEQKQ